MEYNDNLISSPEEFAKMAKEFSKKNKDFHRYNQDGETLLIKLLSLNWFYNYIAMRLYNNKIKNLITAISHQCILDIKEIGKIFELETIGKKFLKPKCFSNLKHCFKVAINLEIEILEILNMIEIYSQYTLSEIKFNHLNNIKELTKYL